MKKILSFFSLLTIAACISAQTIPNGDFENWTNGDPDSWSTYNILAPLMGINTLPITQESPAPSGNYYVKATSHFSSLSGSNFPGICFLGNANALTGTGTVGIPFTETPAFLTGMFKHEMVASTDSMLIICQLTRWDAATNAQILVGGAFVFNFLNSVNNWTPFSSPFFYETTDIPDTLTIGIASIGADGAAVSVDNLGFSSTGNSVNNIPLSENSIALFPNPANELTLLNLSGIEEHLAEGVKIEVVDLTGRIVDTHLSVRNRLFQLNTSNLDSGKYLIRISNSKMTICKSLIKQ
ncbi:MAG: hypothetical protein RL664_838 [Bacteroidota bacterium]|jgi:hypothetical protein